MSPVPRDNVVTGCGQDGAGRLLTKGRAIPHRCEAEIREGAWLVPGNGDDCPDYSTW